MSPNKSETAVHSCHCHGDMGVYMHKVMAIPWSWYVCFSANISGVSTFTRLPQFLYSSHTVTKYKQRAKKVASDSTGLVDFAIGLVNSVFNLPDG